MGIKRDMKIIVIDNMVTMRRIIVKCLKDMGLTNIFEADDGATALPMIEKSIEDSEPFELIISDWNMPQMSGLDLLNHLKSNDDTKNIPFLCVTAEADQAKVLKIIKAGASSFIVKPFRPDDLQDKIALIFSK